MAPTRPLTELQALLRHRGQLPPELESAALLGESVRTPGGPLGGPLGGPFGRPSSAVSSGWASADRELFAGSSAGTGRADPETNESPGLVRGGIHEWFGVADPEDSEGPRGAAWSPPLFVLTHLARRAVRDAFERGAPTHVVWIGRQVWPYPRVLEDALPVIERVDAPCRATEFELGLELELGPPAGTHGSPSLLERSLFVDPGGVDPGGIDPGGVDPGGVGKRLWAIDTALRCGSVTAVIANGSGLGMASTRRLQLAAQAAEALVMLARPPSEVGEISAATTRWLVTRRTGDGVTGDGGTAKGATRGESGPRWRAELLRAKGAQELRRHRRGEVPSPASRSA